MGRENNPLIISAVLPVEQFSPFPVSPVDNPIAFQSKIPDWQSMSLPVQPDRSNVQTSLPIEKQPVIFPQQSPEGRLHDVLGENASLRRQLRLQLNTGEQLVSHLSGIPILSANPAEGRKSAIGVYNAEQRKALLIPNPSDQTFPTAPPASLLS